MNLFLTYIGLYAPIILFVLTLFLLINMTNYLEFFVSGFILNNILNIILKLLIKAPRPVNNKKTDESFINGEHITFHKFGMPSGHAQNCGYSLSFITMVLNNPFITTLYMLITLISLLQRYLYKRHTILQLIVGLIVGLGFGFLTYSLGNQYITGNIKPKEDDDGPL